MQKKIVVGVTVAVLAAFLIMLVFRSTSHSTFYPAIVTGMPRGGYGSVQTIAPLQDPRWRYPDSNPAVDASGNVIPKIRYPNTSAWWQKRNAFEDFPSSAPMASWWTDRAGAGGNRPQIAVSMGDSDAYKASMDYPTYTVPF